LTTKIADDREAEHTVIRVLIVEDNPGDVDLLRESFQEADQESFRLTQVGDLGSALLRLQAEPYDVTQVGDLGSALLRLQAEPYDAVLLDLALPDSRGVDTLTRLKHEEPAVPIVVLTGLNDRDAAARSLRNGAQDYLVKGKITGELLSRSLRYAIERHRLLEEVNASSLVDELTGLYNRRGLLAAAAVLYKTVVRQRKGVTLAFIDLDGMKAINDSFGHEAGDQALVDTARVMRETFRNSDVLARLGGDEFAVLAAGGSGDCGPQLEARLREQVRIHNATAGRPFTLSLSVGYAHSEPSQPCSFQELLARADSRMYERKRTGRPGRDGRASSGPTLHTA
jgi:diguanylate cyclase (GGDEF)-like protein